MRLCLAYADSIDIDIDIGRGGASEPKLARQSRRLLHLSRDGMNLRIKPAKRSMRGRPEPPEAIIQLWSKDLMHDQLSEGDTACWATSTASDRISEADLPLPHGHGDRIAMRPG